MLVGLVLIPLMFAMGVISCTHPNPAPSPDSRYLESPPARALDRDTPAVTPEDRYKVVKEGPDAERTMQDSCMGNFEVLSSNDSQYDQQQIEVGVTIPLGKYSPPQGYVRYRCLPNN